MGNKDNPRRPLRNKLIAGGIGALLLGGCGYGGYTVYAQADTIKNQDELIGEYKKQQVEQGSLIDQQKEELDNQKSSLDELTKNVDDLNKELDKNEKEYKKKESSYKEDINKLEDELAFKRANEAKKAEAKKAETKETPAQTNQQKAETTKVSSTNTESPSGKTVTVEATGYIAMCTEGCTGITATGMDLASNPNAKVIAVDPSVIPLGTRVYVPGYGEAIAADTGGAIDGHKIDIHMPTTEAALDWGRQTIDVTILD